ncbi:hypothetical protein MC885_006336 [Smutsia gigantea]|nr:hypothetical protein MC885_006336 [Smutsia gigantea]
MFLESNICWVSSGTVRARYCWLPRLLVDGEGGVVRLDHCVGRLGGGHDAEGVHDAVRVLLPDLAAEQRAHPRPHATPQRVGQLEALQTVTAFGLLPHHVHTKSTSLAPSV